MAMTHLENELSELREEVLELMELVHSQLTKARDCITNMDEELAEEVIHMESRVNALELAIDKHCENIFALFQPVAIDLRYLISTIKINSDLERLGDHAEGIAHYALSIDSPFEKEVLKETRFTEMFEMALDMMEKAFMVYEGQDTKGARKVFEMDRKLNQINKDAAGAIAKFLESNPKTNRKHLYLFTTIRKLERIGDLAKNIAEEVVFFVEAKVMRHKKLTKKKS